VVHGHVTVHPCNDARSRDRMMHSRLPTCSSFDNGEHHVVAFDQSVKQLVVGHTTIYNVQLLFYLLIISSVTATSRKC